VTKAALARAARQEAAAMGLADPRARGCGFIARPRVPWRAGPGRRVAGEAVPCRGWTRARARVWLEAGDDTDRQAPPIREREKVREEGASCVLVGPGEEKNGADWAGPCGRKGRKGERPAGLGPRGRKRERGKRKREWAGPNEKKREKKNCIQMYLNLNLKFKFKWKTNNKTI
jgi:hypothetical protein